MTEAAFLLVSVSGRRCLTVTKKATMLSSATAMMTRLRRGAYMIFSSATNCHAEYFLAAPV